MSYVRFDTDSDVYVYAHVHGGYRVHVAANREIPVGESFEGTYLSLPLPEDTPTRHVPLNHPRRSKSYTLATRDEVIALLKKMQEEELRVPMRAIWRLRWEEFTSTHTSRHPVRHRGRINRNMRRHVRLFMRHHLPADEHPRNHPNERPIP